MALLVLDTMADSIIKAAGIDGKEVIWEGEAPIRYLLTHESKIG